MGSPHPLAQKVENFNKYVHLGLLLGGNLFSRMVSAKRITSFIKTFKSNKLRLGGLACVLVFICRYYFVSVWYSLTFVLILNRLITKFLLSSPIRRGLFPALI